MIMIKKNTNIVNSDSVIQLINGHEKKSLESFYKKIEYDLGCTYMFYIYENISRDQKIIYTSNLDWQRRLIDEKLINKCPIFKAAHETLSSGKRSIILPWNKIHCKTSIEKEITLFRTERNIANGIGITHSNSIIREGIGLGADIYDRSFPYRILENNLIYKILVKVRTLATQNVTHTIIH